MISGCGSTKALHQSPVAQHIDLLCAPHGAEAMCDADDAQVPAAEAVDGPLDHLPLRSVGCIWHMKISIYIYITIYIYISGWWLSPTP